MRSSIRKRNPSQKGRVFRRPIAASFDEHVGPLAPNFTVNADPVAKTPIVEHCMGIIVQNNPCTWMFRRHKPITFRIHVHDEEIGRDDDDTRKTGSAVGLVHVGYFASTMPSLLASLDSVEGGGFIHIQGHRLSSLRRTHLVSTILRVRIIDRLP
jgi:hypothetical protein